MSTIQTCQTQSCSCSRYVRNGTTLDYCGTTCRDTGYCMKCTRVSQTVNLHGAGAAIIVNRSEYDISYVLFGVQKHVHSRSHNAPNTVIDLPAGNPESNDKTEKDVAERETREELGYNCVQDIGEILTEPLHQVDDIGSNANSSWAFTLFFVESTTSYEDIRANFVANNEVSELILIPVENLKLGFQKRDDAGFVNVTSGFGKKYTIDRRRYRSLQQLIDNGYL